MEHLAILVGKSSRIWFNSACPIPSPSAMVWRYWGNMCPATKFSKSMGTRSVWFSFSMVFPMVHAIGSPWIHMLAVRHWSQGFYTVLPVCETLIVSLKSEKQRRVRQCPAMPKWHPIVEDKCKKNTQKSQPQKGNCKELRIKWLQSSFLKILRSEAVHFYIILTNSWQQNKSLKNFCSREVTRQAKLLNYTEISKISSFCDKTSSREENARR